MKNDNFSPNNTQSKIKKIKNYNKKMGFDFEQPQQHFQLILGRIYIKSDSFKQFLLNNGMISKIIEEQVPKSGYSYSKIICLNGEQIYQKVTLDQIHRSFKIGKYNNPRTQDTQIASLWETNPYYMCMLRARNLCFYSALPQYSYSVKFLEDLRMFRY